MVHWLQTCVGPVGVRDTVLMFRGRECSRLGSVRIYRSVMYTIHLIYIGPYVHNAGSYQKWTLNYEMKPHFYFQNTFRGHLFLSFSHLSWSSVLIIWSLLLNYLNLFHTNCLILSLMLRTGLSPFWPKCQHRFLEITFLFDFCHTKFFISEFHFWLRTNVSI
jgi:hypothetical protein